MAIVEHNLKPSRNQLNAFGLLVFLFFGLISVFVWIATGALHFPIIFGVSGAALCGLYFALPPIRLAIYRVWMLAVFPVGWTFSIMAFAIVFYLILTPIGLFMRLFGRDPLKRYPNPNMATYWVERQRKVNATRYFQQF